MILKIMQKGGEGLTNGFLAPRGATWAAQAGLAEKIYFEQN
jgi:hypothetical protein